MKNFIRYIAIFIFFDIALMATDVGVITAIKGDVKVQRDTTSLDGVLGFSLKETDSVITADKSKAQIIFHDETIVTIGKNSNFSVAKYIYDNAHEPVVKFGLLRGAMKTITGKIGKIAPQRFEVKTKTATIGIRGTNFVVIVEDDAEQKAYCTYGAISVRVAGDDYLVRQGFYLDISPFGEAKLKEFDSKELQKMQGEKFGYRVALRDTNPDRDFRNQDMLDNTKYDKDALLRKDTDGYEDDIILSYQYDMKLPQEEIIPPTLSELIAGYTMSDASYTGISVFDDDGSSGTATLDIDFGADTASLSIKNQDGDETVFSTNPQFNDIDISMDQTTQPASGFQNDGSATGTFQESKGNEVKGDFAIDDGYGNFTTGTYDVSSSQTLH